MIGRLLNLLGDGEGLAHAAAVVTMANGVPVLDPTSIPSRLEATDAGRGDGLRVRPAAPLPQRRLALHR